MSHRLFLYSAGSIVLKEVTAIFESSRFFYLYRYDIHPCHKFVFFSLLTFYLETVSFKKRTILTMQNLMCDVANQDYFFLSCKANKKMKIWIALALVVNDVKNIDTFSLELIVKIALYRRKLRESTNGSRNRTKLFFAAIA